MVITAPFGTYTFVSEGTNQDQTQTHSETPSVGYLLEQLIYVFVQHRKRNAMSTDAILDCFQKHHILSMNDLLQMCRREFVELLQKECMLKKGCIIALWNHLAQDMQK